MAMSIRMAGSGRPRQLHLGAFCWIRFLWPLALRGDGYLVIRSHESGVAAIPRPQCSDMGTRAVLLAFHMAGITPHFAGSGVDMCGWAVLACRCFFRAACNGSRCRPIETLCGTQFFHARAEMQEKGKEGTCEEDWERWRY